MLEIDISQRLGDLTLEVKADIPSRGITAIFGVSGAGKTSLINAVVGLTRPQSGHIILNGRTLFSSAQRLALPPEKRRVGYVFQDGRLFPHYRVRGNLFYGMADSMRPQFDAIISLLGIGHLLGRFPITLSGGEKQRVAIGRALLSAPEILLMDEPLASLDLLRKRELLPYLERLAKEVKIPILYVTHSMEEILQLAERVLILDNGKMMAFGSLEEVWASSALRPWLPREEQSSVLEVSVDEQHPVYAMTALSLGRRRLWVSRVSLPVGSALRIRVAAADISLVPEPPERSSIRNILPATVRECLRVGDQIEVRLDIDGHTLWARVSPWALDELGLAPDMALYAQIKSVSINA
ncbi:molybdenum ABC transporter ATP-binding protein ModC [Acerihabitans arboris]|uniref:Molybdenum ABC transporter ATP-binding protein ModC n=1 Tax=Acerihabitans arboris TaxID=2691583 RepID=A0A845SFY7_9GAMM|nr:molybdenum ABC transporter ATP-binding protein ModC [Acerihabitans arboris]NDL62789.1 molybdenum ABC transporter ATP-binding protein ModC [Acerihabitans arboris]